MKKMYFTITGCAYLYGLAIFKPGMAVTLIKEPYNKYDREAIRVEVEGLGTVGYVANSPKTVRGTSMSAGRLYDKIGRKVQATVDYVLPDSVLCSVGDEESGYLSEDDSAREQLPAEEEFLSNARTDDIDLYSQEDTYYLIEEVSETDNNSEYDIHVPQPEEESDPAFSQPVSVPTDAVEEPAPEINDPVQGTDPVPEVEKEETVREEAPPDDLISDITEESDEAEKTLSPEEIASALTAALASLTAGGMNAVEEDPDAEYIYGNRTSSLSAEEIGNVLSEELAGMTTDSIESVLNGSSGLSAADFVNALTGNVTVEKNTSYAAPEESGSEIQPTDPETVFPEREERVSSAPGLNFNTVRFPEEEEGYTAPVRDQLDSVSEAVSEEQEYLEETEPGPAAANENEYSDEPVSDRTAVEDEDESPDSWRESADEEMETVEVSEELSEEETPDTTEPAGNVDTDDTDEAADGITKPLVYDESDLDENLAQLHLGDIDATYLSDSFLANLKEKLKQST